MVGQTRTSVAIIGGGPGGLGTAISLSELPFLEVTLYEKHSESREAGAGLSLSSNAWRVLDLLGASRGGSKAAPNPTLINGQNAYTGKVLSVVEHPENSAVDQRGAIRARRTRLQQALLARVPEGIIKYSKKLVHLDDLPDEGVRLTFADGTEVRADIVVGADGIHSAVRKSLFPDHKLRFTGNTAFRVLVPKSRLISLPEITSTTAWWWGKAGHVYFSDVDDEIENSDPLFEITVRSYHEPEIPGKTVGWGIPAANEKGRVPRQGMEFDQRVRDAVDAVEEGEWWEFAGFAGPRLDHITGWGKVALIGDASHPLSGAFGSGATFAMEDGWILARALELTQFTGRPLSDALEIFSQIRSPYYTRMYNHLDEVEEKLQQVHAQNTDFDGFLKSKIDSFLYGDKDFIYKNDISKVWDAYLEGNEPQE
ncbi:FAD-binding monooxygenase [Penicillium waksmanii]|uniref:FAD-binding monooxygenase n=1 Tax=Penicillium waksmanii TaxID=69791 RepID=UPI0025496798|nr:FAD-binding monooxygenase [Penicillium waksmanii]KAJ5995564.1 FAD-binding monooxygenase [Penicillium waksmanii]